MAQSILHEKAKEVTKAEKKVVVAKGAWDATNRKVGVLEGKLEESDTKLAQALSVVSARDKELEDTRKSIEQAEQKFYDAGFDDTKRSAAVVIKEAKLKGFIEGWMVVFNGISLPLTSPFRDPS